MKHAVSVLLLKRIRFRHLVQLINFTNKIVKQPNQTHSNWHKYFTRGQTASHPPNRMPCKVSTTFLSQTRTMADGAEYEHCSAHNNSHLKVI